MKTKTIAMAPVEVDILVLNEYLAGGILHPRISQYCHSECPGFVFSFGRGSCKFFKENGTDQSINNILHPILNGLTITFERCDQCKDGERQLNQKK